MAILDFLLGRPLATSAERQQRLGPLRGVPAFGLDALSSAAYGPEAALTVLLPVGLAGLNFIMPITIAVIVLLGIVYFSYRQTIAAYPTGAGSYTVARENLGQKAGLLAAAALMIDYILNVAVAISSGIGALVSAIPKLQPQTLTLTLAVLVFLALMNLRGLKEASSVFLVPTCMFIICLLAVIVTGLLKTIGHASVEPVSGLRPLQESGEAVSTWLLLRAFASGCTALTGVEAVSNGVQAFREPVIKSAHRTLTAIVVILMILLVGIAYLTHAYHIVATPPGQPGYETILSQLTRAVVGKGPFYIITIASILAVLTCSANTSFADFPRVCRALAADGYLPQSFANRGRRLVYTEGIVVLTILAAILLWAFGGITDRLIPLFAVGAFVAFTLSQAGMVMHWKRARGPGVKRGLTINSVGAVATGLTAAVIAVAKFREGAWVSILLFIGLVQLMSAVRKHYDRVDRELALGTPLENCDVPAPLVVVPVETWNKVTRKALLFAYSISSDIQVVHVRSEEAAKTDEALAKWERKLKDSAERAGCPVPSFVTLHSPFRFVVQPIVDHVFELERQYRNRTIAVVIPQVVESHWYHHFLHNQRGQLLTVLLLLKGDRRIVPINVPWYFGE